MKERPILFFPSMVRAILAGTKTQTRRAIKPVGNDEGFVLQDYGDGPWPYRSEDGESGFYRDSHGYDVEERIKCPYGRPGDRLWVRESFSGPYCMEAQDGMAAAAPSKWAHKSRIWYWADGQPTHGDWTRPRPSIHMPRWASRITLEVTDVKVERLQDISEADAVAEGTTPIPDPCDHARRSCSDVGCKGPQPYKVGYRSLWESINGPGSWDANPHVWCISFRRIHAS
jgi:hypothetical protein